MPHNKMICPVCGLEMNHHAEKLINAAPADSGYDSPFDRAIEESHTCPGCGTSASRVAT